MKTRRFAWVLPLILALVVSSSFASDKSVQVNVLTKTTESWNKIPLPRYPKGQPQVTILRIIIPPATTLPMHTHPVINAGLLIKGELTVVTKDGKTLHLKEGDPIVEVVNTWHYGKNEGTEPVDIVVFYAGVKDASITVKE
ncbi:MAG: cupin domain-containing protein [Desulfobacteraceae bacterium]|nr:cupin domain-containing protein [Desulfobacteraceae bacterium]